MMRKQVRSVLLWINISLFTISLLFYVVLLRAPSTFVLGAVCGLVAYFACYGLIRIGWNKAVRVILYTIYFSLLVYGLYALLYSLMK